MNVVMKWQTEVKKIPKLNNLVLVEGLPGVGNVGKICAEYLIDKLKAKKLAELACEHFPYHVFINQDDVVELPKNELYYHKSTKKGAPDVLILTGDVQSMNPTGHYETVEATLDFISENYDIKAIYTIGGFGGKTLPKTPKVIGAVSSKELIKKYEKYGVKFEQGKRVGMIIGASGLFIGLGKLRGIPGMCLMGETINKPMFADTKSAQEVLKILTKIIGVKIDMRDLESESKKMEDAISKAKEIEKRMIDKLRQSVPSEELRYIG